MVHPVSRRKADPGVVQKLWAAISAIRLQKQVANVERITRHMQREHEMRAVDIELQLQYAVSDGMISIYKALSQKGTNAGSEQDGYRIEQPEDEEEVEKGDHDWYCYDCHKPGDVLECSECWRVYHSNCTDEDSTGDVFVCTVCKDIKKQTRMKRKELNRLLGFTIIRLKDKSKELHWFGGADQGLDRFVYLYMDLNTMEDKSTNRKYKYLEQFYADARTILHNIFICYGDTGVIPHLARIMIRDCRYDLDEIRQCKDCYHHSNNKPKDWFCQPCRPPHELVYAKQKGFSYWPAKVIKITQEGYDVRFFGSLHQRAVVPSTSIKPIDTSLKQLSLKRTMGFGKAMKELARHQEILQHFSQETDEQSTAENEMDDEQEKDEPAEKMAKIHHKKFHKRHRSEETGCVSSSLKLAAANRSSLAGFEDSYMVSSSEDKVHGSRVSTTDVAVQTSKKLTPNGRQPNKSTQTEEDELTGSALTAAAAAAASVVSAAATKLLPAAAASTATACDCETKCTLMMDELREKLESEHQQDKDKALKELEERLWKESEEEQQKALNRALNSSQRENERLMRQTEERMREDSADEVKKLVQKHKMEISIAKKKQWCYNCEEEAMYHCCWNTSYCSIKCQQEHWHTEHKRMCRRKRN